MKLHEHIIGVLMIAAIFSSLVLLFLECLSLLINGMPLNFHISNFIGLYGLIVMAFAYHEINNEEDL